MSPRYACGQHQFKSQHSTLGLCGNRGPLWLLHEAELLGVQPHVAEFQSLRNARHRCIPLQAKSTDAQEWISCLLSPLLPYCCASGPPLYHLGPCFVEIWLFRLICP